MNPQRIGKRKSEKSTHKPTWAYCNFTILDNSRQSRNLDDIIAPRNSTAIWNDEIQL